MAFTRKQVEPLAESLGIDLPKKPSKKKKHPWLANDEPLNPTVSGWNPIFDALCKSHGLPLPEYEYLFDPWKGGVAQELCTVHLRHGDGKCPNCGATRRLWRFDYLFEGWLAVEKQGGVWTRGRHSRGKGQIADMEKFNAAAILGYQVLFFTPVQLGEGKGNEKGFCSAFPTIKNALESIEI
jgi:hypothetical protein